VAGDLAIRPLRPDDDLSAFQITKTEHLPLLEFLQRDACAYQICSLARTHVLVDAVNRSKKGRVWGFVSLVASEVKLSGVVPRDVNWPESRSVPAIKVARMAMDESLQRGGLGRKFASFVIGTIAEHVAPNVGVTVLVTDAKKDAVGFYEKVGFTMLDTEQNKRRNHPLMFINLTKI
jgi:GNAT superfamily N-acetyltransferase